MAAKLDPNAWYLVSETRVTNVTGPFNNNLQTTGSGLRVYPTVGQAWQFQPIGKVDGRYLARLNTSGVREQLSVCWRSDEVDPSKTIGCMSDTVSDESQQWDISDWGDGSFKFANVANGSKYVLDVHPGSNLFMSSEIDGINGATKQVAQHWVLSSERPVNDGAYSTIYSAGTSAVPSATATSTGTAATGSSSTTATANPSSTPSSTSEPDPPSGGISSGAAAGIGVGVGILAVALIGAAVFFWWRRRRAATGGPPGDHHELGSDDRAAMAKLSPGTINASTAVPSPHNDYYGGQEAKTLGHAQPHAHAAEAGHTPIYEAPAETRYELGDGQGYGGQAAPAPAQLDTGRR